MAPVRFATVNSTLKPNAEAISKLHRLENTVSMNTNHADNEFEFA